MRKMLLLSCAASALLFANMSGGSAQSVTIDLTPQEEMSLFSAGREAPATFEVEVGADVPAAIELYDAPGDLAATTRRYKYTRRGNKIYVVDPQTRKVVRVITRRS